MGALNQFDLIFSLELVNPVPCSSDGRHSFIATELSVIWLRLCKKVTTSYSAKFKPGVTCHSETETFARLPPIRASY